MAKKKLLTIGTRVRHNTELKFDEGVVVYASTSETNLNVIRNKPFSVHWADGKRGNYSMEDISRINPKSTLKQIKKELEANGEKD